MATQIYNQLGKVPRIAEPRGVYTLNMIVPIEGANAAPVTKLEVEYIKGIKIGAPSVETLALLQQAGGDNVAEYMSNPKWAGSIVCYRGKGMIVQAQLQSILLGTSFYGINSYMSSGLPSCHWEMVIRDYNNHDHIKTMIMEDMVIMPSAFDNPIGSADFEIPFYCRRKWSFLYPGYEMVYDRLDANGSGVTFVLSSTPVPLADSALWDQQEFNNVFQLKHKPTGDDTGTIVNGAACTLAVKTFTFTTAPTDGQMQCLYAKAVVV